MRAPSSPSLVSRRQALVAGTAGLISAAAGPLAGQIPDQAARARVPADAMATLARTILARHEPHGGAHLPRVLKTGHIIDEGPEGERDDRTDPGTVCSRCAMGSAVAWDSNWRSSA